MSEPSQILTENTPDENVSDITVEVKTEPKKKEKKPSVKQANDPVARFSGDGVVFKAKLFGTADVKEPRGDAMCATAMNLLKAAVKTTGEHKQRILMKINLSGIVLVDAVSQMKLYEHQVNRISFISKDGTDNRAFGYITSDKDGKHKYFGIKTERAAEQVVMTLRDLFQTVFDLKKKEAEMKGKASDVVEEKTTPAEQQPPAAVSTIPSDQPEPTLGDATDTPVKEVKREDSQSHLLDLLENISFQEPSSAPQPAAVSPWGTSVQGQTTTASSWGPAALPAQNDPFVVQSQPAQFGQSPFNQQQPAFTSPFSQPQSSSPAMMPPAQPAFQPSPFAAPQPGMFSVQQQQQPQYSTASIFPQQQQSPFSAQSSVGAVSVFSNDPFATNGFQQTAPPATQSFSSNPFASGNESFGVLQPVQAAQPAPAAPAQFNQQQSLFSDLNPISSSNPSVRKDQFFSDVKNPPKPKLSELANPQASQSEPQSVNNNTLLW